MIHCVNCECVFICELAIQNHLAHYHNQSTSHTDAQKKNQTLPTKRLADEKSLLHTNTHSQTVLMVLGVEAEQKSL